MVDGPLAVADVEQYILAKINSSDKWSIWEKITILEMLLSYTSSS